MCGSIPPLVPNASWIPGSVHPTLTGTRAVAAREGSAASSSSAAEASGVGLAHTSGNVPREGRRLALNQSTVTFALFTSPDCSGEPRENLTVSLNSCVHIMDRLDAIFVGRVV